MNTKIPFGLRGDRLLGIEEVRSGLGCGCVCPACGAPLVAKKGQRQAHHFAHYKGHACAHGLETALHLKAKAIFQRRRQIVVPPVYLHRQKRQLFAAQLIRFERVRLEEHLGRVVPDILLQAGRRKLLVEIAVSHAADERKARRLLRMGLPALEIDAASLYKKLSRGGQPFDASAFEYELVHGLEYKRWLFHRKKQGIEYQLRKEAARRPVKHSFHKGYHHYLVAGCPLHKQQYRSGFREGKSYARLWQDCLHCPYCLEIGYGKEIVGYQESPQQPKAVYCWGHLPIPKTPEWMSSI